MTVPASGPRSGDSEVNTRVNGGAHPSCHEPTSRPPASPGFRSGLHRRCVAAGGGRRGERLGDGAAGTIRLGDSKRNAGENAGVNTGRHVSRARGL